MRYLFWVLTVLWLACGAVSDPQHTLPTPDPTAPTPEPTSTDEPTPTPTPLSLFLHDSENAWSCALGENCQDVFDIEFTAGSVVTFQATQTTGGSVLQVALYAPTVALGELNLFTEDASELRCNFVSGCTNNQSGQTIEDFLVPTSGTYRLAVTRHWGSSCGGSGTYRLIVQSDLPFSPPNASVDDAPSLATSWGCPE